MCVDTKAIFCYVFVLISVLQIYWLNGYFSKLLRSFEKDADKHDQRLRQRRGKSASGIIFLEEEEQEHFGSFSDSTDNAGAIGQRRRPLRHVINTLNRNPSTKIIKIDQSYLTLQQNIKVPMVAYISASAQLSGIIVLSLKVCTTII